MCMCYVMWVVLVDWRRGDYVEGVGMLSVQESWCEALQTGAWQVEAGEVR